MREITIIKNMINVVCERYDIMAKVQKKKHNITAGADMFNIRPIIITYK